MLTVRDSCVPHPNVLKSAPEPDIEDIGAVIEAAEKDAAAFFARNHITGGIRQLFELGIARLDGRSDQAVYTLIDPILFPETVSPDEWFSQLGCPEALITQTGPEPFMLGSMTTSPLIISKVELDIGYKETRKFLVG